MEFQIISGNAGTGMCQRGAYEHGCEFAPVAGTYFIFIEILSALYCIYVVSVVDEPRRYFYIHRKNWSYRTKCVDENRFQALKIKG